MPDSTPRTVKRSRYLIDPKWQLTVSLGAASAVLSGGLLYLLGILLLDAHDPLDGLTGRETGLLALGFNALYFLLLGIALAYLLLRITHAVSGPAMVIERAVERMRTGTFDSRLKLRRGDYLKSLAAAVERLSKQMEQQQAERERLCQEIERAMKRGDKAAARTLLAQIRAPASVADATSAASDREAA